MIQKAQYQEPQSEIILLSAPMLLSDTSNYTEDSPGSWEDSDYDI